ncbi:Wall-associated kinase family protein [Rhynchospora pubera]|uniref:Wall-associated kinase family protein n=1 Tax=Rhynchospora pubera TaxID=906938 RepID=A0AAV8HSF0_9POAL|nr:Wall-associated kinase family protein [Rhynchospora pubera]
MKPKTISQTTRALVSLLMLSMIMLFMPFQTVASRSSISLPGCPDSCAGVDIPYPFGFGPKCAKSAGFELSCKEFDSTGLYASEWLNGTHAPFLFDDTPVLKIIIPQGRVYVYKSIISTCSNTTTSPKSNTPNGRWNLSGTPYRINQYMNILTFIGCDMIANVTFGNETNMSLQGGCSTTGCYSWDIYGDYWNGTPCGHGCCQTYVPEGINYYHFTLQQNNSNNCGYAELAEENFNYDDKITSEDNLSKQQTVVTLDWIIGTESCATAKTNNKCMKDGAPDQSYSCTSDNSVCVNSTNGPGHYCLCSDGYEGNPYVLGGCVLIPIHCAFGALRVRNPRLCQVYLAVLIVGLSTGFCAFPSYFAVRKRIELLEKRKQEKLKQKFFNQNKGFLLQQRIKNSDEDATQRMRIFTLDELEKATNKFDNSLILGQGGHGEVYKGILSDQRVVAIKRSKKIDQAEIEQFINEVVILSEVNHRNVVKIYGCCLETEVPLLVYEFISNGTLSKHLHAEPCSLTWRHRLGIALESARAIAYLHSSASISIFHRDIKSDNILLDDYFTAKVSDFGTSRSVEIDQTGITTCVQGTFGYLDPEYFYSRRLTPKSDVYSFGVIIAELLTRKKPLSSTLSEYGGLVLYFTRAVRENRLFDILDPQIAMNEAQRKELEAVANLAEMCVRRNVEERPTMKEVEVELEILWRKSNQQHEHPSTDQNLEEKPFLLHDLTPGNDTARQYSFEQELPSSFTFRR